MRRTTIIQPTSLGVFSLPPQPFPRAICTVSVNASVALPAGGALLEITDRAGNRLFAAATMLDSTNNVVVWSSAPPGDNFTILTAGVRSIVSSEDFAAVGIPSDLILAPMDILSVLIETTPGDTVGNVALVTDDHWEYFGIDPWRVAE